MYIIKRLLVVAMLATVVAAQSVEPPLADNRLTIHTLLREDIFSGFLADNMEQFSRGERNIDLLLEKRPTQKGNLLAWKGGATLYRAVRAYENKQNDEFQKYYDQALAFFAEAEKQPSGNDGLPAVRGGSFAIFADRLPKQYQAAAWQQAYSNYQSLYKQQAAVLDKLPVHFRGEVLGGLAQAAQRTGRTEEMNQYVDRILTVLAGTPYETVAKKWKANPKAAASVSITCLSCHDAGRLGARLTALNSK